MCVAISATYISPTADVTPLAIGERLVVMGRGAVGCDVFALRQTHAFPGRAPPHISLSKLIV